MKPLDRRLMRLVPAARPHLAVLAALGVLGGLAAIAQAFAVSALVVAVATRGPWGQAAVAVLATFAVRGLAAGATEVVAARAGALVSTSLRADLVEALLSRPADDRPDAARAVTLATQGAASVEPYVARYLPTLVGAVVLPPAAVLAMGWLDWRTAVIPVLTLPLLPLFAALIGASTADETNRRWRTLAQLSGHFLDVMRGLPTLVTYGRARRQAETIRAVSHDHRRASVATLRLAFLSSGALELLATISVAIVAVWVGIALAEGRMELGVALPLILLAPEAYWPIRRVGAEFHNAADGAQALGEVADELGRAATPAPSAPAGAAGDAVVVKGLSYGYGSGPLVLDGLDAELHRGLTVVVGPSGAGKTTLLELLAGLRRPTSGTVSAPAAHLVTQRPFLAPATLRENLLLGGPEVDDDALTRLLARVGLGDLLDSLPDGLDTPLGDDGFGLSAGQRSRVATARALLSGRDLLLFDEPTAHLDAPAQAAVHTAIRHVADERTVVVVTHRPGLLELADARLELGGRR